jgi:hypothetical protein
MLSYLFISVVFLLLLYASFAIIKDLVQGESDETLALSGDHREKVTLSVAPGRLKFPSLNFDISSRQLLPVTLIFFLFFCFINPIWREEIFLYSSFTDDFFYYLQIANNFIDGYGFAFTRGIHTNGYQPLHQYLITALAFISRILGFEVLIVTKVAFGIFFLLASLTIFRMVKPVGLKTNVIFMLGVMTYYFISYTGMESLLIVPILTYLCLGIQRQSLTIPRLALLLLLCFFARIDSIIIIIPLAIVYIFSNPATEKKVWQNALLLATLVGGPICLYFLLNYYFHDSFFPVSGLAKSVESITGVHKYAFKSFLTHKPFNVFNLAVSGIFILYIINRNFRIRPLLWAIGLGTFLFYLQTSIRSDWGLWSWYFYPIPVIAFMLASKDWAISKRRFSLAGFSSALTTFISFAALAVGFIVLIVYTFPLTFISKDKKGKIDILHVAGFNIRKLEAGHRGVYAMGDRAAIVGYLLESPLIQLEGLVMNKKYLRDLAAHENLEGLLKKYNVKYYISSNPVKLDDSTYVVKEPAQSNGHSKVIIDTINWKVVNEFTLSQPGLILKNSQEVVTTTIFQVP